MIEVKELMVGDWVTQALADGTSFGVVKQMQPHMFTQCNFEPIELTPEILAKNGFKQDDSYDECIADGLFVEIKVWSYYADNILITWDGGTCKVVNDIGSPCEEITLHSWCRDGIYVHELQRALRCCGLWELAENFKV